MRGKSAVFATFANFKTVSTNGAPDSGSSRVFFRQRENYEFATLVALCSLGVNIVKALPLAGLRAAAITTCNQVATRSLGKKTVQMG